MILCDTNIIIEFYKNNITISDNLKIIGQNNIAISSITAGELIYGARNKKELSSIKNDIASLQIIDVDVISSKLFIKLMAQFSLSHKLSLPDALIAAICITNNLEFYTLNKKDFKYIQDIKFWDIKALDKS